MDCFCLLLAGCEFSFDPVQENDKYHYSMYGYLDASADTQWVRVMPVRDSLFYEPKPLNATVILENTASGETVEMKDSLYKYVQGVYTHNFWTTMDIEPVETYRITATSSEASEKESSSVEVTLPEDFPTPLVVMARDRESDKPNRVYINGVEQVADVQTIYQVPSNSGIKLYTFPHLKDTISTTSGEIAVVIDRVEEQGMLNRLRVNPILKKQIFVAAAGPNYPKFARIEQSVVVLPKGISNVENGVGFVGGIVSKTVPYKACYKEGTETFVPCPLEPPPW